MSTTCRECGHPQEEEHRFCPLCGIQQEPAGKATLEGIEAFEQGEYEKALKLFKAVVKRRPQDAFALRDLGHAAFHLQDHPQALEAYRKALQIQPNLLDAQFNLGLIHLQRGRVHDAMYAFLEALNLIHPLTPGTYYLGLFHNASTLTFQCRLNLGGLFKERGELEKALEQYRLVAEAWPKNILAQGSLGDCLMALERFDEAMTVYKRGLKLIPDGPEQLNLRNDLGVAYFRRGEMERAVEEFKTVLQMDPGNANAVYNLGQLYRQEGQQERMRKDFEEYARDPENGASILYTLAQSMVSTAITASRNPTQEDLGLVGASPSLKKVQDLIKRAAAADATVLILGENGTGKEVAARAIHQQSSRHDKPFVPIACSVLSESLLESELFGHEKGSFTGALDRKLGKFEAAQGGTVFLDEIGELNLSTQVKLLRVLQEREFERVGGTESIKVDIRVIAATNRDLKQAIKDGRFREDLYYRLNVIAVQMPPLREREGDLTILARHFLEKQRQKRHHRFEGISQPALEILKRYRWPGNVRELENLIERVVTLNDDVMIRPEYLPLEITGGIPLPRSPEGALPESGVLESMERDMIERVLRETRFNKRRAADRLGISRPTLYEKLRRYGLKLEVDKDKV
jgi:two-component system NtrC family response regulator